MKVETPQILWNSEGDKNVNAALLSVAVLSCGGSSHSNNNNHHHHRGNAVAAASIGPPSAAASTMILATAGNSSVVNLWAASPTSSNCASDGAAAAAATTGLAFRCSLGRQDGACNCVRFSPNGLHLAAASEHAVVVWSIPPSSSVTSNNNSSNHPQVSAEALRYWSSSVAREQDLQFRVAARNGEAFVDVAWSADSNRIVAGSIDHSVVVCEVAPELDSWRIVYRHDDHAHFVQGVAFDPLGVYLASMSSDRTVRLHAHKKNGRASAAAAARKGRKNSLSLVASNVLNAAATAAANANAADAVSITPGSSAGATTPTASSGGAPTPPMGAFVGAAAVDTRKLEMTKSKLIKYYRTATSTSSSSSSSSVSPPPPSNPMESQQQPSHRHLFQDEATLESFVRRLSFTSDGAYLVAPAAQWWRPHSSGGGEYANATLLFARHRWDEPCRVLAGMQKPSVAVRPCPVLFQLPDEAKENALAGGLPYRSAFCVLTWDSVLVYDTYHTNPLAIVSGLHYCNLVDAAWSADGRTLFVCSTDGYVSIVRFDDGELGQVYVPPRPAPVAAAATPLPSGIGSSANVGRTAMASSSSSSSSKPPPQRRLAAVPSPGPPILPPCEPGLTSIEAPPLKRAKLLPCHDSSSASSSSAAAAAATTSSASAASFGGDRGGGCGIARTASAVAAAEGGEDLDMDQLTIHEPKAKKKRIQPTFIATN